MFVYSAFSKLLAAAGNFSSDTFRALIERSTSTYSPNIDHPFLDSFTGGGGVELSVASYARVTLGTKTITQDDTNDRVALGCATLAFGNLEAGQTAKAIIGYRQVGGDDSTPGNDELAFYYDGKIDIYLAANAAQHATLIYVDPLQAAIPSGTALNFGGGKTCTTTGAGAKGARSLAVDDLAVAATAGDVTTGISITGNILPFTLGGGAFNVTIDANGMIQFRKPSGPA